MILFSLTSSRIDSIRASQYLVVRVYCCSSSMSRAVLIFVAGRESDIPMSRESFWRLLHRAFIKNLAFAALNKLFCLPVKIGDGSDKGLHRAYRTDPGTAEGTADALLEFCASLVIEKCHDDIVILLADKIELALQCNPIMLRRTAGVTFELSGGPSGNVRCRELFCLNPAVQAVGSIPPPTDADRDPESSPHNRPRRYPEQALRLLHQHISPAP